MLLALGAPTPLDQFLAAAYDPASPSYRRFVTPAEFTGGDVFRNGWFHHTEFGGASHRELSADSAARGRPRCTDPTQGLMPKP
jgi:hypothetical protein